MPELYSLEDLRRVFGAEKARELARALWAASQKPLPARQLEALRDFCEGEEIGQKVSTIVPALRVYLREYPTVARRMAAWCEETLSTGGIPGGLPLELQDGTGPVEVSLSPEPTTAELILSVLTREPMSVAEIQEKISRDGSAINRNTRSLLAEGKVVRIPTGKPPAHGPRYLWRLP